jgi:hypothetical protein
MLRTGRPLRLPRAVWLGFAAAAIALGAVTALLLGGDGRVYLTGVPELELPLPPPAGPPRLAPAAGGLQASGDNVGPPLDGLSEPFDSATGAPRPCSPPATI